MKKSIASKITFLALLILGLTTSMGCDDATVRGGATVVLENISVGSLSVEGKPLAGLPSQNVNVVLNVATNEVRVNSSGGKTTMKLNPSGATVVIAPEGTTFTGVKSDQVQIQWQTDKVTPTGVPAITNFSANPSTINAGQSSTLQWNITGATSASISGIGAVSATTGTQIVSPAATTSYILTAANGFGSATASATITVPSSTTGVPVIANFTANPTTIAYGQSSTLQWNITGASSVSITPNIGVVSSSGTQAVSVSPAASTTYILTATNSAGSATASTTVTVTSTTISLPVISSFTANPGTITAGQTSNLTWSITGATSISISPGIGVPPSNFGQQVTPPTTTTYSITATNSSGSATASTTVIVR
jgi:hypothetical protein